MFINVEMGICEVRLDFTIKLETTQTVAWKRLQLKFNSSA